MRYAGQLEAIENLLAALVAGDDAGFAQDVQVLRGGGPTEPDRVHEITDATLAVHKGPNERQPSGAPECLEDFIRGCAEWFAGHVTSISLNGETLIRSFRTLRSDLGSGTAAAVLSA
jgi:hypothetical protein